MPLPTTTRAVRRGALALGLVMMVLMWPTLAHAQWNEPLRTEQLQRLQQPLADMDRVEALLNVASTWMVSNKAMPYLRKAEQLLDNLEKQRPAPAPERLARLREQWCYQRGYQAKYKRDLPYAMELFRRSRNAAAQRGDTTAQAGVLDAMGTLLRAMGEPRMALATLNEALALAEQHPPSGFRLPMVQVERAAALLDMDQRAQAADQLGRIDTSAAEGHADVLLLRARLSAMQGDTVAALAHLARADSVVQHWPNAWNRLGVLTAQARLLLAHAQPASSAVVADQCAALAIALGDEAALCACRALSGEARMRQGLWRAAEQDLRTVLDTAAANGYIGLARVSGDEGSMVRAAELLRSLYLQQDRTADALAMTLRWVELRDSLRNLMDRDVLVMAELRHRVEQDSLERAEQSVRQQQAHAAELASTRRTWAAATSAAALLAVALLVAYRTLERKRRRERRIAELELQRSQQEAVIADMRTREALGRDLHDDLGLGLSALKMKSELARQRARDPDQQRRLAELAALSDELLGSMRQIIWTMGADQGTLADTAAFCINQARSFLTDHGIAVTVEIPDRWPELQLSHAMRRDLLLVVKETVHNVLKHSGADRVHIRMAVEDGLQFSLADNGNGSTNEAANSPNGNGVGIQSMKVRMARHGGNLVVEHGEGTVVRCVLPLPRLQAT